MIAKFTNQPIEKIAKINIYDLPLGKERDAVIKQRVKQSFFRSTILSSYNLKCCITGLTISDFLVASHIIPWSIDEKNRLNPHNGLCLNSIHDKAFDKGFISITPDFKVKVSKLLTELKKDVAVKEFFIKFQNHSISLPDKFKPSKEFLDYHYNNIFQK